jgi:hypothetical protein
MWKTEREREKENMIARITPLSRGSGDYPDNELPEGGGEEIDNSLPSWNRPPGNATLPVLPGIWPPPGKPNLPVRIPVDPGYGVPIFISEGPENPIALPPGIYPPLPPSGGTSGKVAVLVWVVGVGYRWAVIDTSTIAQPK